MQHHLPFQPGESLQLTVIDGFWAKKLVIAGLCVPLPGALIFGS